MTAPELKPCPFCGKTPNGAYHFGDALGPDGHQLWAVRQCCVKGHGKSEAEAIAGWNTRALPAVTAPVWPDFIAPPKHDNPDPRWTDPALPDFRTIWKVARECGYAIGLHGSMKRDCDLIAAPWTDEAVIAFDLIERLCAALNAKVIGPVAGKPHSRLGWNLQIDGWFKVIDISVLPRAVDMRPAQPAPQGGDAHDEQLGVWADELMADLVLNDFMDLADHEYDTKIGARRTIIDALKAANQAKVPPLAPAQPAPQGVPDHVVKDAQAFDDMSRVADKWMHKVDGLQREIDMLSDPNVVHINMLRGTIAQPTVEQIIHLYGVDVLAKALARVIVREAGIEPVAAPDPAAIREAALREAADHISRLAMLRKMWSAAEVENIILALIQKGPTK